MILNFEKYHGAENDFILINGMSKLAELSQGKIAQLCDRHFGIGADGLIILQKSDTVDFKMVYFNSDGNVGSMCGNGGRCAVVFANSLGIIKEKISFDAFDGIHEAVLLSTVPTVVKLKMAEVSSIHKVEDAYILNTGSPHFIKIVADVDAVDILAEGKRIRNSTEFIKEGINVNFVQLNPDHLKVRTYERGVEAETLSCGTGVTAVALAMSDHGFKSPTKISTPGGELKVHYLRNNNAFVDVWLEGEVEKVFAGSFDY